MTAYFSFSAVAFSYTEPCVAWHTYDEFKRWFPRCYHDYSSENSNEGSSGSKLELVDVSPAYVVDLQDSNDDISHNIRNSGSFDNGTRQRNETSRRNSNEESGI